MTHYVTLRVDIEGHPDFRHFVVVNLDSTDVFLGFDWMRTHNPVIDWVTGDMEFSRCTDECLPSLDTLPPINFHQLYLRGISIDIAAADNLSKPKKTLDEQLPDWLKDFRDVFEPQNFDQLPPHRPGFDHTIILKDGAPAMSPQKIYPLNPRHREVLREFIDEHLKSGRIRPSKSPYAAPFFFVDKTDGGNRPTQDYRWLNEWTVKDKYPLPLISDVIDKLRGSKIFTTFDIRWGYNNVRIKEGDEWKAAFITEFGLFEPLVMFFGLCNSPPTFQRLMDTTFHDFIIELWLLIYMDDHNIHDKDPIVHREHIRRHLQRCRENKLFLKIEKCKFEQPEVAYLGMVVSENEVRMNPLKVSALAKWPVPRTKKDVQSFIGFANYY